MNEKFQEWLQLLLEPDFLDKQIIMEQVRHSKLTLKEKYVDAWFIGFEFENTNFDRYPHNVTVPVLTRENTQ